MIFLRDAEQILQRAAFTCAREEKLAQGNNKQWPH